MALTTEEIQVPQTPSEPKSRSARPIVGWAAVGAALLATGVLAVVVLTPDSGSDSRYLHYDVGDAKDHPNYNPVQPADASPAGNGDAKDHPLYNRTTAVGG